MMIYRLFPILSFILVLQYLSSICFAGDYCYEPDVPREMSQEVKDYIALYPQKDDVIKRYEKTLTIPRIDTDSCRTDKKWFKVLKYSADRDKFAPAQYELTTFLMHIDNTERYYSMPPKDVLSRLNQAAQNDFIPAIRLLAQINIKHDPDLAIKYITELVERGDAESKKMLEEIRQGKIKFVVGNNKEATKNWLMQKIQSGKSSILPKGEALDQYAQLSSSEVDQRYWAYQALKVGNGSFINELIKSEQASFGQYRKMDLFFNSKAKDFWQLQKNSNGKPIAGIPADESVNSETSKVVEQKPAQLSTSELILKADTGDKSAMYLLALRYFNGENIEQNNTKALHLFLKSGEEPPLLFFIVISQLLNRYCDPEALKWLESDVDPNIITVLTKPRQFVSMSESSLPKKYYDRAIANHLLATLYLEGSDAFPKNDEKAILILLQKYKIFPASRILLNQLYREDRIQDPVIREYISKI